MTTRDSYNDKDLEWNADRARMTDIESDRRITDVAERNTHTARITELAEKRQSARAACDKEKVQIEYYYIYIQTDF